MEKHLQQLNLNRVVIIQSHGINLLQLRVTVVVCGVRALKTLTQDGVWYGTVTHPGFFHI